MFVFVFVLIVVGLLFFVCFWVFCFVLFVCLVFFFFGGGGLFWGSFFFSFSLTYKKIVTCLTTSLL